ncbi:hypothetical protein F5Y07DRAFT_379267 [Xylaria sp. FL0933]|nr:hypothetical protein F5Y07DRAFT_379267 [Xylaria sp. FL0933]
MVMWITASRTYICSSDISYLGTVASHPSTPFSKLSCCLSRPAHLTRPNASPLFATSMPRCSPIRLGAWARIWNNTIAAGDATWGFESPRIMCHPQRSLNLDQGAGLSKVPLLDSIPPYTDQPVRVTQYRVSPNFSRADVVVLFDSQGRSSGVLRSRSPPRSAECYNSLARRCLLHLGSAGYIAGRLTLSYETRIKGHGSRVTGQGEACQLPAESQELIPGVPLFLQSVMDSSARLNRTSTYIQRATSRCSARRTEKN